MTTTVVASGPYPVRIITQTRPSAAEGDNAWTTTGSVEYPAEEAGRREATVTSTQRVIVEEYIPAPSEHDEQAEIDRVSASNDAANAAREEEDEEDEDK